MVQVIYTAYMLAMLIQLGAVFPGYFWHKYYASQKWIIHWNENVSSLDEISITDSAGSWYLRLH